MNTVSDVNVEPKLAERPNHDLTVAEAVWIGTALLQKKAGAENRNVGFDTGTIVVHVFSLRLTKGQYKSIWQHVNQHCVANRPPHQNRTRMLFAQGRGFRRLFREGDRSDEGRRDAPFHPEWHKLPPEYQYLQHWFEEEWNIPAPDGSEDPLLAAMGSGAELWKHEHADEYVSRLRADWGDSR